MYRHIVTLFLGLILLSACHTPSVDTTAVTDTVVDDYGRSVVVPTTPQRIVSTSPAVTEIVFALGKGNNLVGRTDYCTYPPEAASVTSIGGITNLNVEQVLSLTPDLVISGSMVPQATVSQLDKMGVPLVSVIEKNTFDGLYDNIRKIGSLIGAASAADSLANQLAAKAKEHTAAAPSGLTAYYVVGFGSAGNYTAGGNTFINDIITMAGLKNIAADMEGWSYSLEQLMQHDPDYIIIRAEDAEAFCKAAPYSRLAAVKQHRVIPIESGMIDIQGPRNIDALTHIYQFVNKDEKIQ